MNSFYSNAEAVKNMGTSFGIALKNRNPNRIKRKVGKRLIDQELKIKLGRPLRRVKATKKLDLFLSKDPKKPLSSKKLMNQGMKPLRQKRNQVVEITKNQK